MKHIWNFFERVYFEPLAYLNKFFKAILLLSLAASFIFFGFVVLKSLSTAILQPNHTPDYLLPTGVKPAIKDIKPGIIGALELIFLAPLPFVIIGAFYFYYKVQLEPDLSKPFGAKYQKDHVLYASYFLSLSKLLFVATLISLLITKLLEVVDFHDMNFVNSASLKSLLTFFATIVILVIFYFILERGIHSTYKSLEKIDQLKNNEIQE